MTAFPIARIPSWLAPSPQTWRDVMTNIVPFRRPTGPVKPMFPVTAWIQPNKPLEVGDLVAFQLGDRDGSMLMFRQWYGPDGRDENGRFVKKGSTQETH